MRFRYEFRIDESLCKLFHAAIIRIFSFWKFYFKDQASIEEAPDH